jgi:hypothetical protein
MPTFHHSELLAPLADDRFGDSEKPGQVAVGEAVLLGLDQEFVGQIAARVLEDPFLEFHQLLHLFDEPGLDVGLLEQLLYTGTLAQGLVHDELPLAGRFIQHEHQLLERLLVVVLGESETVTTVLSRTDRLLESLLVGLPQAHDLTDGAHLGAELVLEPLELLECPAGELHDHVVAGGGVFLEGAVAPVGNLVHRQPAGQERRDIGDGKPGRLRRQRRRARGPGIDLDHHDAVGLGIMRKLDVGAPDDLDGLHDVVGVFLQAFL